jgi:hypothetical protein
MNRKLFSIINWITPSPMTNNYHIGLNIYLKNRYQAVSEQNVKKPSVYRFPFTTSVVAVHPESEC